MTERDITTAVFRWWDTNYTGVTDFANPLAFDPETESVDEFVYMQVHATTSQARRRHDYRYLTCAITVHCCVRTQDNLYAAVELASAVGALLEHAVIPVEDTSVSDSSAFGYLYLQEVRTENVTKENCGWQEYMVTVEGTAQETV